MQKLVGLLFLLFFFPLTAQVEICNNATDDDNDGLIDLNDDDCNYPPVFRASLFSNPSFEDTFCCPNSPSQIHCVVGWYDGSEGTSDYFNTSCNIIENLEGVINPKVPSFIPDGYSYVGFLNLARLPRGYKEYIHTCIDNPLNILDNYRLDLEVGFGISDEPNRVSSPPLELSIYGNTSCILIPYDGVECPLTTNNEWSLITSIEVEGFNEWKTFSLIFQVDKAYQSFIIGPNCERPRVCEEGYYFLDKLVLEKETAILPFLEIEISSGLPCAGNTVLSVDDIPEAGYQWYKNGIAILGAINSEYELPLNNFEGEYSVVVIQNNEYYQVDKYIVYPSINYFPQAILGEDLFICNNQRIVLGEKNLNGNNYLWNTGASTKTITVTNIGEYSVTITNDCGESIDEIIISEDIECSCIIVPTAFTPNRDRRNDYFCVNFSECFFTPQNYSIRILSRWGEEVFYSEDSTAEWDGIYQNTPSPSDVYIVLIQYENSKGNKINYSSDITLLR